MTMAKTPDVFMAAALLALTRLSGEFTVRQLAEKLTGMGVPVPPVAQPLRTWALMATEATKRGLLVKTKRSVMERTGRTGINSNMTERAYFYERTALMEVKMPPSRLADAEKFLAQRQAQVAQP